jgi:HEAT repeat protein
VSDPRWYFVRNVVGILGSAKSSAALSYLERTLRHPDSRVRRETIRSLSGITDRVATEMLIAALQDEDAQNVQLAARYLGASGARAAITPLEMVARGEGRGNRENGPRVEAIESLGKLGAVESLPILEALAGRRKIINPGKARELRAAAEAAINRIRTKGGAR